MRTFIIIIFPCIHDLFLTICSVLCFLPCVVCLKCRDVDLTEKLDYSSAVAFLGYSLIMSILRSFDVRDEAARVMVAAPLLAFLTAHILFINFYKLDYGT